MPYKPTGRPNGRPRKHFPPPPARTYLSATAPVIATPEPDAIPPIMGQRKRVRARGPALLPTPLKA